ncbi:reverse transcriptase family protein [Pseudomonas aeruginosa]|uniref:reverse transcriptase family protein n=1 Tax=Pseudomonas aeruginosa TaxID=287 RepID=UPI0009A3508D|nr:reverse transcriptase family protein [Pseudomonas aeruginosa]
MSKFIPQGKNPRKISKGAISSIASLCSTLNITLPELEDVLSLPDNILYTEKEIPKAGGKVRVVYNPHRLLRRVQRKINTQIFSSSNIIEWPTYLYGSIPNQEYEAELKHLNNKDYVSCAARHCGARSVLKLDVESFFDNVHEDVVRSIFADFLKCSPEVSDVLTSLCCKGEHIVQGALTSSYLASLCLYDVEGTVAERLRRKGFVYTRLVDDITVSSKKLGVDFSYAKSLIVDMLKEKDLPVNEGKTKVYRASTAPLTVHGLRIGFSTPRLPSDEVRRIRAAVRNVELLAKENNYRTSHAYRHDFNRCMGRVNKLERVKHNQHQSLVRRLKDIKPLPSIRDIGRAKKMLERLRKDYRLRSHTYWYRARYFKVLERLNVLQRTYEHVAFDFRVELKGLKPTQN